MIKIGLIGTGVVAGSHASAIGKNSQLQLTAVSEIDAAKGEPFAAQQKCKFYPNYADMLAREELEVVVVCLPHHLHYEAGLAILQAGKHLFMEKPFANTVKECDNLIRKAKEKGLKLMVGHTHQYLSSVRKAAELIKQGEIGTLNLIIDTIAAYYNWEKRMPWHLDPSKGGGGALMNTGPHQIDHLLYLTQSRPVYVKAGVKQNRPGVTVDSDVVAHIEFANGVIATLLLLQGYTPKTGEAGIRLIGTEGMIEVNPWGNLQLAQKNATREIVCEDTPGIEVEWAEMVASIQENRPPITGGEYGRNVVALISAIYESARTGRAVKLTG